MLNMEQLKPPAQQIQPLRKSTSVIPLKNPDRYARVDP